MPEDRSSIWEMEKEYEFLDYYQDECDHTFNRRTKTLHYLKRFISYQVENNRITFQCLTNQNEELKVLIEICSPYVFRLIMSARNEIIFRKTPMVIKQSWSKTKFNIYEDENGVKIDTKGLTIEISKDPWRIFVKYDGKLITKEGTVYWPSTDYVSYWPHRETCPLGFSVNKTSGEIRVFDSFSIFPDEHFYGLGEKFTTLDKRGRDVVSWNVDAGASTTTDRAYKNIPFFISTRGYGIFINSSFKIKYQMGSYSEAAYSFELYDHLMDYYFILGPEFDKIIERYTDITGRPSVPPLWSFGTWMSHLTKEPDPHASDNAESIEAFAKKIREEKIPCDVIHIGGWLRKDKCPGLSCDLVWDRNRYPDPEGMLNRLKNMGFKVCLWISPFVPKGTSMYEEGDAKGYFAKDEDGKTYKGMSWGAPDVGIVDFTNPDATLWFKNKLKDLMKMGVHAFKTDMGESIPLNAIFHDGKSGKEIHNVYPLLYHKTVFEATQEFYGEGIVWGRGGYAGVQRYPIQWAGDPRTRFEDMCCVLRAGLSYGISGVPFWSHDAGGFFGEPTFDLYIRWIQFAFLSSHTRCYGTTPRHPWAFGDKAIEIFKKYANLRYQLIPYLYSYAKISNVTGLPLMRALVLEFQNDINVYNNDLQYMLGKELMVAPIFNDEGERWIYFPEGKWHNWWDGSVYKGPLNVFYKAKIDELPIFVRSGAIIPLGPIMNFTGETKFDPLTIRVYPSKKSNFVLYDKDGATRFECTKGANSIYFLTEGNERKYLLEFHDVKRPRYVRLIEFESKSKRKVSKRSLGYSYDERKRVLRLRFKGKKFALKMEFQ